MNYSSLTILLLIVIGVHQMCTANPEEGQIGSRVSFTADELRRAKGMGISHIFLFVLGNMGLNIERISRLHNLLGDHSRRNEPKMNVMTEICEIMDHTHKTSSNSTNDHLEKLLDLLKLMEEFEVLVFLRSNVCVYLSEPQSNILSSEGFTYEKLRLLNEKANSSTGMNRVHFAKRMCCVRKGGDLVLRTAISDLTDNESRDLTDNEMMEFDETWRKYAGSNSFQDVCDFVEVKHRSDYECHI
ncbi:uncharacterized protein LOC119084222 [Bradysia coprophila]|uniref:uncharacterized protein LOC119084222 n=1 Tax=Bradysia coprophila TaxID=38358 RepID=UPI00187D9C67|nr:uncharacterized protein LOC119084222 [Bradysia coprophila]